MTEDLSWRLHRPYILGLYLAVNAIRDAHLLVDGPSCLFYKMEFVHGSHDWASTLMSSSGRHRIWHSDADVNRSALDNEGRLARRLKETSQGAGALFFGSLPFCVVNGTDYARLLREARAKAHCPLLPVGGNSLNGDWLQGYADALTSIAEGIRIPAGRRKARAVAVVGHLMDRNEGDQRGNASVLRTLLGSLGFDAVSIWLSGGRFSELEAASQASVVISLPYGRAAARRLAERTGAQLIETDLPLGLDGTRRWLLQVGKATGRRARAEALAERELAKAVPALEWIVPHALLGRRFVFSGDPYLLDGLGGMLDEFGGKLAAAFVAGDPRRLPADLVERLKTCRGALFQPTYKALTAAFETVRADLDLLVSDSQGIEVLGPEVPWIELGYPSNSTHFLTEQPFLGFSGCLNLVQRLVNAVCRAPASRARPALAEK
jgi:nitrogenase molybdenum-iron protein alpha/beta subunit